MHLATILLGGHLATIAFRFRLRHGLFVVPLPIIVSVADPQEAVDVVRHYDESVQENLVPQLAGSLLLFGDDFSIFAEVHPAALNSAE